MAGFEVSTEDQEGTDSARREPVLEEPLAPLAHHPGLEERPRTGRPTIFPPSAMEVQSIRYRICVLKD
jgi:hypothetical protein